MLPYLFGILAGYCLGSVPSAYLLVRRRAGIDIRAAGSGNVGSFNTFVVTRSISTAIAVGLLDGIKGLVTVLGVSLLWPEFWVVALALIAAIVGHIFPFWLKFKGGRGLATGCGGFFGIGVGYTILWCLTWGVMKLAGAGILRSNIVATLVAPAMLWVVPGIWIQAVTWFPVSTEEFRIFGTVLSGVLLVGHRNAFMGGESAAQSTEGVEQQ